MTRNATMIESVHPDELIESITAAVLKALGPMLLGDKTNTESNKCATRSELAVILRCSESTIDRLRAEGMPSLMVGGSRTFIVDEALAWAKDRTPDAEAAAAERQRVKHAAKRSAKAERQTRLSAAERRADR